MLILSDHREPKDFRLLFFLLTAIHYRPALLFRDTCIFCTHFQVPYPVSPLFAALAETAGVLSPIRNSCLQTIRSFAFFHFHALTWNPFCNPSVFKFRSVMEVVPPPERHRTCQIGEGLLF